MNEVKNKSASMTYADEFKNQWKSVCLRLKSTGYDLSKIKLKKGLSSANT